MKKTGTILIVDDDEDILTAGKLLLKRHFSQIICCSQPTQIPELMSQHCFDVIILDMNFSPGESTGRQGFTWLEKILRINSQAVVVMITAHSDVDMAVEAMKKGATDFISKPWQNDKVIATLSSALELNAARSEAAQLRQTNAVFAKVSNAQGAQRILGNSAAMRQVMSLIERSAPTDANVLILGENGTGKELVARELHAQSLRAEKIFMSVDLGAVSESLFESELFGHKKGAFTGAQDDRVGRLQAADGGTLFLDEIGNLPLHLQAKLLTVLEQRKVTPLGANASVPFNVRVLAATNLSKDKLNDEATFRQDLLFRLNTVEIQLPPLRERRDDIEEIALFYLNQYCRKYSKPQKKIADSALQSMMNYHWPGNIRALRHAIERAVILAPTDTLNVGDFQLSDGAPSLPPRSQPAIDSMAPVQGSSQSQTSFNLESLEKTAVHQALKQYHYNVSHAAKALGLTRAALYRRMEKYGL